MRREFIEQYRKMPPLVRNAELLQLFVQLPPSLSEQFPNLDDWMSMPGKGAALEEKDRRRRSETREILGERMDSLLTLSHLTIPAQAHIAHNYAQWYIRGVDRLTVTTGPFNGLLFKDHAVSPGVFEPEPAREIERQIYRSERFTLLRIKQQFEEMKEDMGIDPNKPSLISSDLVAAISLINPNKRFTDPEGYARDKEAAISEARRYRELIASWPNEFFKKHGDEI